MGAPRVEQRGMDVDPHRRVLLPEIVGKLGVGHQMEPHQLHGSSFPNGVQKIAAIDKVTSPRPRVNRRGISLKLETPRIAEARLCALRLAACGGNDAAARSRCALP